MKQREIGFTQGVVYAIAQCVRFGNSDTAEYLWNESGFKKDDLKVCDEYDVQELRRTLLSDTDLTATQ